MDITTQENKQTAHTRQGSKHRATKREEVSNDCFGIGRSCEETAGQSI